MDAEQLRRLRPELDDYLEAALPDLGRDRRRRWAGRYVRGLLLGGGRRSMTLMAGRLPALERGAGDAAQAMQRLVTDSPWDDRAVRARLARRLAAAGAGWSLALGEVALPKQGEHSPGVDRQPVGPAGRAARCQVAVTLCAAADDDARALDLELYLPASWAADAARRQAARIPDDVAHRPRWRVALALLERARLNGLRGVVVADGSPADGPDFRAALEAGGWAYCLGVSGTLRVTDPLAHPDRRPGGAARRRPRGGPAGARWRTALEWAVERRAEFRRVRGLRPRYAAWRVRPAGRPDDDRAPAPGWLLAEWRPGEREPTRFSWSNLPAPARLRELARAAARWRWADRVHRALKRELGLGDFEGRTWPGWHRHATLVLVAAAFLAERRAGRHGPEPGPA